MTRRLASSALLAAVFSLAGAGAAAATSPEQPSCPPGTQKVASHSGIHIDFGRAEATVDFAVADGCHDVEVTLASYRVSRSADGSAQSHEQLLFDVHAGRFSAGEIHTLAVAVDPACYHHVMLVLGPPVEQFGPEHSFEEERERTVDSELDGGPDPCGAPLPRQAAITSTTVAAVATPPAPAEPPTTVPAVTRPPEPPATTVPVASTTAAVATTTTAPPPAPVVDPQATPLVIAPSTREGNRLPFTGTSLTAILVTGLALLASGVLLLARSTPRSR